MISQNPPKKGHIPVLLDEIVKTVPAAKNALYLDGTFGGGGYSRAVLEKFPTARLVAIDRDPTAIARASVFKTDFPENFTAIESNFGAMKAQCEKLPWCSEPAYEGFHAILLDLGLSSFQIDAAERGFSFKENGPLDMRMGHNAQSAEDIVNEASEETLADIFYYYGEERCARRIARKIVQTRLEQPLKDTATLAALIRNCLPPSKNRKDPATRSFQALRIAVNDELNEVQQALADAPSMLAPNGVFAVVSFHSLEDRLVKKAFNHLASPAKGASRHLPASFSAAEIRQWELPAGYPVAPSEAEIAQNPRARSARLRVLKKLSTSARECDYE